MAKRADDAAAAQDAAKGGDGRAVASSDDELAALSFEASAERLAAIVAALEGGELSLERSLELFEEGVKVARAAQARLTAAEKRVEELIGVGPRGEPKTRELSRED